MAFPDTIYGKTDEIYKPHSSARHDLGTTLVFPDGRRYKYMKDGGSGITRGYVIGTAAVITTHDSDVVVMEARTTAQWDDGDHTIRIHTTGSTSTTSLNLTTNQYAEGYIWVNDEAGERQLLQVKEHGAETATGSTGGLDITCYDDDILTVALTTATPIATPPPVVPVWVLTSS